MTEVPATAAAPPAGNPANSADAPKQPEAAAALPPAPIVLSDVRARTSPQCMTCRTGLGPTLLRSSVLSSTHITLGLQNEAQDWFQTDLAVG